MYYLALFLFVFCTLLVFYTYVVYPWLVAVLAAGFKANEEVWVKEGDAPVVSVLIAAFNEEKVITDKIKSVLNSSYPSTKLEILIGSDASTDRTAEIISEYSKQDPRIRLHDFKVRRGKPSVINDLVGFSTNEIIILTDANVLFDTDTIFNIVCHFRNEKIGLVGANILNVGQMNNGISHQETSYIARENRIKYFEGIRWGVMMGPFGGCYALRKKLFKAVPANFLVDDFYICMQVLKQGYLCINELKALCYEDVSNDIKQEYKRKARISAGNFQNLKEFSELVFKPFTALGFCFISHKVLRWLTPFFLITSLLSLAILGAYNRTFFVLFIAECILLLSPLFDAVLRKMGLHWKLLRFVAYFSYMNLALLKGFFLYLKGVRSSVWTPTLRNTIR